jgi:hypothetical protein
MERDHSEILDAHWKIILKRNRKSCKTVLWINWLRNSVQHGGFLVIELSFSQREEHRLRVFENKVLRTYGRKRHTVTEKLRKLHGKELQIVYLPFNIVSAIS